MGDSGISWEIPISASLQQEATLPAITRILESLTKPLKRCVISRQHCAYSSLHMGLGRVFFLLSPSLPFAFHALQIAAKRPDCPYAASATGGEAGAGQRLSVSASETMMWL